MMDPRYRQVLRPKDHLQLRQQVKVYPPLFWLLPFLISTHKYLYNFYMLEKRWIFIENAYSELLTLVLCSSLIKDWMMDPRHRKLLGPKNHLQLRQQVKAYLPFFLVITVFHAKIYSFIYVIFPCKINSYYTVTVNLRFP